MALLFSQSLRVKFNLNLRFKLQRHKPKYKNPTCPTSLLLRFIQTFHKKPTPNQLKTHRILKKKPWIVYWIKKSLPFKKLKTSPKKNYKKLIKKSFLPERKSCFQLNQKCLFQNPKYPKSKKLTKNSNRNSPNSLTQSVRKPTNQLSFGSKKTLRSTFWTKLCWEFKTKTNSLSTLS